MISDAHSNSKKTRLAIYGGAFDPIHNGHLSTIALLLASGQVDKVVVVPSGDRPDKPQHASAVVRFEMVTQAVREAFGDDTRVSVSDLHVAKKVGYGTIDLVDYFVKDETIEPIVVLGHELLGDLSTWKEGERLQAVATFLVIKRPGALVVDIPKGLNASFLATSYEAGVNVSSTTIRQMLSRGFSCAGLLPRSVEVLCRERGLYR